MPWVHAEWVPLALAPLSWFSCASLGGTGCCFVWTLASFSLASFSDDFPSHASWSHLSSRMLNMFNTHVSSLGKNPVLDYSNANSILGNIVDISSFVILIQGIPFSTVPVPLMSTISSFLWICMYVAKGTTPCFPKDLQQVTLLFPFVLVLLAITGKWWIQLKGCHVSSVFWFEKLLSFVML